MATVIGKGYHERRFVDPRVNVRQPQGLVSQCFSNLARDIRRFTASVRSLTPRSQAIVGKPRNDVEVRVVNNLAGGAAVVEAYVERIGSGPLLDRSTDLLQRQSKLTQEWWRAIEEVYVVLFRNDKRMPVVNRSNIKKSEHGIVFVNFIRWHTASDNFAKHTISHT